MGTALTGNTIASSYLGLLKSTDSLAISSTAKTITDGAGNDLPIKLSTAQFLVSDGSSSAPTIGFSSDTDTGLFRTGSGVLGITSNGTLSGEITLTGYRAKKNTTASAPNYTFIGDDNTGLHSLDADRLDFILGGNRAFGMTYATGLGTLQTLSTDSMAFHVGSERIRIINNGGIGIGTSTVTSGYDIDVLSSGGDARILLRPSSNDEASYQLGNSSGDILTHFSTSNGSSIINHAVGTGTLQLKTNASKAIEIDSSQNIQFNAYGGGTITGTVTQRLGVDSSGNVIEIPIGAGAVDGSGTAGKIVKWSDSDTITDSVISESSGSIQIQGRLGVGLVPESTVQLSVNGQIGTSSNGNVGAPDFTFYGDDNTGMYRVGADSLGFTTGGTNAITLDSSQNATFAGDVIIDDAVGRLTLDSISGANRIMSTTTGFASYEAMELRAENYQFKIGANEKMRLDSSGNLGLGTSSPNNNANRTTLTLNHATSGGVLAFTVNDSRKALLYTQDTTNNLIIQAESTQELIFNTSGANERMRLDSSGRLGLGTSTPLNRMTVSASNTGTQITTVPVGKFINTGNSFSKLVVGSDNVNFDAVLSMDNDSTLANTKLRLYIGNGTNSTTGHSNDHIVLQGNGNVGIGESSPDGNLEVIASTVVSGASDTVNNVLIGLQSANRPTIILDTADTTYTNRTWNITNLGSSGSLAIGRNGLDVMVMDNNGNSTFAGFVKAPFFTSDGGRGFKQDGAAFVSTYSNGTDADAVNDLGKSTNRWRDLYLYGDIKGYNGLDINSIDQDKDIVFKGNQGGTTITALTLDMSEGGNATFAGDITVEDKVNIKRSGVNASTSLQQAGSGLIVNAPSGYHPLIIKHNSTELYRFTNTGNLGIGTSSPSKQLTINGDNAELLINRTGSFADTINMGAPNGVPTIVGGTDLAFGGTGTWTEHMRITSDGNVGIGESSPSGKLDIRPNNACNYVFTGTSTSGYTTTFNMDDTGIDIGHNSGSRSLNLKTDSLDRITILGNGKVGIGTDTPDNKFHVVSGSAGEVAQFTGAIENRGLSIRSETNTDASAHVVFNSQSGGSKGMFSFETDGSERMRLDSSGRLGLGTTSPSANLDIRGTLNTDNCKIYLKENNTFGAFIKYDGATNEGYIGGITGSTTENDVIAWSRDASNLMFLTSGSEQMRISSGGDILIDGTYNPYTASNRGNITLNGTDSNIIAFTNGTAERAFIFCDSTNLLIRNIITGDIRFDTNSTERLRITGGGDVLVGKTSVIFSTAGTAIFEEGEIDVATDGGISLALNRLSSDGETARFYRQTNQVGSISVTTSATAFNTSSDYRLKEDLQDFNALDIASKIKMYDFKWKADDSRSYGVMAHELQEVLPQAVSGDKDAEDMQQVDYSKLVPILLKSIQELKAEIDILKKNK